MLNWSAVGTNFLGTCRQKCNRGAGTDLFSGPPQYFFIRGYLAMLFLTQVDFEVRNTNSKLLSGLVSCLLFRLHRDHPQLLENHKPD